MPIRFSALLVLCRSATTSKRKRLDDSLPPDWQRVDEAFQAGRVSDEIFPGWKVPTYYEAQQKADDVIRRQFERARLEYGND